MSKIRSGVFAVITTQGFSVETVHFYTTEREAMNDAEGSVRHTDLAELIDDDYNIYVVGANGRTLFDARDYLEEADEFDDED